MWIEPRLYTLATNSLSLTLVYYLGFVIIIAINVNRAEIVHSFNKLTQLISGLLFSLWRFLFFSFLLADVRRNLVCAMWWLRFSLLSLPSSLFFHIFFFTLFKLTSTAYGALLKQVQIARFVRAHVRVRVFERKRVCVYEKIRRKR